LTVNVCPAIVTVPDRADPLFAATVYDTVPFPVPLAPAVTVMNDAALTAVQTHPLVVVTATLPEPPAAAAFWLVGEIE
jgi:hypothetical protein